MTAASVFPALLVWSEQVCVLAAAAALASLAIANPKHRLAMWQGLLLILLLLPAIEPWRTPAPHAAVTAGFTVGLAAAVAPAPASTLHWRTEYWLWLLAAGALLRLLWTATGFLRLRGYRRQADPLPEPPLRFASNAASWYASASVPGPVTYGWRRPVILLPSRVLDLPAALREAVQCHELIHVRRGDWLFVLAETVVRGLLWFHPAIWFVTSRIHLAREQAVDQEAVSLLQNRESYLDALVAVAAHHIQPDFAPAFLKRRHLAARVNAVMKEVSMSRSRIAAGAAAASSLLSIAAYAAVWLFPFVGPAAIEAQTTPDSAGVTVNPGAILLHRAAVRTPAGSIVTGTVILDATIDAKGNVTDARVISGPEELRNAALSSVLQWHYQPGPSSAQVSIAFEAPAPPAANAAAPNFSASVPPMTQRVTVGGRGQFAAAPAPPTFPATVKSLRFTGLSADAEQQLRSRLNVHEGDTITQSDFADLSNTVRSFDDHLLTVTSRAGAAGGVTQLGLEIRVRPEFAAAPPPPPPPPPPGTTSAPSGEPQVSAAVMAAKVVYAPKPVYPPIAKQARIQGDVVLNATVAPDGTVQRLQVVSSQNPLLTPAAIEAVKQWVYQPSAVNGQPTAVQTQITVNFSLQ